ncbi:hypothetical protein FRC07_014736 [Ceratobasidium sp. 392]|nr:hypothetical protein FRC07_014736 [Ceratobasidium sp. 392]
MYARRLRKYVVVEDELESALVGSNKSDDNSDVFDVGLMTQKLRSLLGISDSLMWNEWPWAHVYHPIKSHVLSSVIEGEDKSIEVAFSNESSSQAMSVSAFQDHLLERIKLHSRRVESFGLGQAAHIREELEEKLSQVWALVRNDDDKDWAPAEPVVTFNPVVAPPETAFEYGSDDGGWIYGGNLENDDSTDLASEDGAMPYWGGKVKKKNGGTKKKSNNKTKKKRGRGIKRHEELKRSEGIAKRKPILIVGDESP